MMLSSASNVDQSNNFMEINYINMIGCCALILTIIIMTTLFSCCGETTKNKIQDGNQNASNVVRSESHQNVADSKVTSTPDNRQVSVQTTGSSQHRNYIQQTVVEGHSRVVDNTVSVTPDKSHRSRTSISPTRQSRSINSYKDLHILEANAQPKMAAFSKPRGLYNNGNTCYFNSVMQVLTHTSILQAQFDKINDCGDMIRALKWFYISMHGHESSAYDPHQLQLQLFSRTGKFSTGMQHDSHECFLTILHELRKDESKGRKEQLTIVDKVFGGHLITTYTCNSCEQPLLLCEPFLDISLPICSANARKGRRGSGKRPQGHDSYMLSRTLTPIESCVKQEISVPNETYFGSSKIPEIFRCTDIEMGSKKVKQNDLKRKKEPGDGSRDRNTSSKIRKQEPSQDYSKFATPRQVTSVEQDQKLDKREEYKRTVSHMMSTPSKAETPGDLCTIDDCLRRYTRREQINGGYLCQECNNQHHVDNDILLTTATKQSLIFNPPAVLTIQLKRFENKRGEYVKRSTMVHYDEVLDIRPYCTPWRWPNIRQNQNIWYSLYAVVIHSGSLVCGHYKAYVKLREYNPKIEQFLQKTYLNSENITAEYLIRSMKNLKEDQEPRCTEYSANKEGTWYCMNDDAVNRVSLRDVLSQEAFLLFYERL